MREKAHRASDLFIEGYNCAQSVACAFAPEIGLSVESVARLTSGFGGGFGRLREVCGCVSGMTLIAGMLRGYDDPAAKEEKAETYAMIQTLAARFKDECGSLICRELLELKQPEITHIPAERTPQYYQERPCCRFVAAAADILEQWLQENPVQN